MAAISPVRLWLCNAARLAVALAVLAAALAVLVPVAVLTLPVTLPVGLVLWFLARRSMAESRAAVRLPAEAAGARVAVVGGGIAGTSAAWALRKAGYTVHLFEARAELGGNAKTCSWGACASAEASFAAVAGDSAPHAGAELITGLSVLAWPAAYFNNYRLLLAELKQDTTSVDLPFFVQQETDGAVIAHNKTTPRVQELGPEFTRWRRMVRFVRAVNNFLTGTDPAQPSLYAMSYLNPLNLLPLRFLSRCFGVSDDFWLNVVVPIYSSSFLTAKLDSVPAVIAPVLHDLIPLDAVPTMLTWKTSSADVFRAASKGLELHLNTRVTGIHRERDGLLRLNASDADGNTSSATFDRVVLACNADAALAMQSSAGWLERLLLGSVTYTDDSDDTFLEGTIHSDPSVLPAEYRSEILASYANYILNRADGTWENTFCVGSWVPAVQPYKSRPPMLITYNPRKDMPIANARGTVSNRRAHPDLSLRNLIIMSLMRLIQGRNGVVYCGSYATPGNGHDLSCLSGLLAARTLGADYPFAADKRAAADCDRLAALMGLDSSS